jgi:predicted PurR-regulated permease PerM
VDPMQILGTFVGAALVGLIFLIPVEMLHKAGFSRWIALFIPFTAFIGLAIFAFIEWPIQRELAWLRLKTGMLSPELIPSVERYALELERRGEWKQAAEVYEHLSNIPSLEDNADYYRNCVKRLKEHLGL